MAVGYLLVMAGGIALLVVDPDTLEMEPMEARIMGEVLTDEFSPSA